MKWNAVIVFVLLALLYPPAVHASPDPLTCAGYAEPRVYLESQAWWEVTPGSGGDEAFGRIETATCFPLGQKVRGSVPLDIYVSLHDSPGKLSSLAVQISPDGSGSYVAAKKSFKPPLTCAGDCTWLIHLDANTSGLSVDGTHEWRIRPGLDTPDGDRLIGSTSWSAQTDNGGRAIKNYRSASFTQGKGWYSNMGYAQSRISSGYSPGAVVHGIWNVALACDASSAPVTGCMVAIDPGPHLSPAGTVLLQRNGGYNGTLQIDTTRLANGPHRLAIVTDVVSTKQGSTMTGVLLLPFTVANG